MAKNFKRALSVFLALIMCVSTLSVGVSAAETPENPTPAVTVQLVPGAEKTGSAYVELDNGKVTRDVKATTSDITVTTKQTPGKLTAVQPALKFDRNNTADQAAKKKSMELYTDNGHFHDPATFTVTDAPEGYPFKYVGHGDYSGHYISHVRVVYKRDAAGNALKDANGNYVIDHLEHVSSGTPLYYGGELTTNIDGPFHYATGTRPQQFLLKDEAGETFYGYCIDLATGAEDNTWYALANLEDNDYYATQESEDHVRGIVFNGYWGTESGTGSLASLKETLKAAVAAGTVEDEYKIKMVNRKKFTTGYELAEGEYHYGNYVYWDLPAVDVKLTAEIIDAMTEGEALDAMQAAIWSYANGSQATLNGVDGVIIGDMSAASSAMSDSLNGKNDPEGAARTRALYAWLMSQKVSADDAKTVIVNDKTFVEDMSLTIGKQLSGDVFEAKLSFSNSFTVDQNKDNLKIVLTYVDANGETQTIEKPLTGADALVAENGYYTIDGLTLSKANPFQFTLNIVGEQYLTKNAYIFTSEKGVNGSQTFVSLAEGTISVDVSKTVDVTFDVENKFTPVTPPEHENVTPNPSADKTDELINRETNRFEVEVAVPGEDGDKRHDEVILMVDGSYSMDNEWPAMKEAITTIGKTVLNGSGNTQLTLMAFGMGDNEVLVHVKDADELAAALGELPGNLLYGRSSTNCEAGFTGVAEYIANHDSSLNEVNVIFISDGNINTDETPRDFYFNWRKYATAFGALTVAQAAFENSVSNGANLPAAFSAVFGDRFAGATRDEILTRAFANKEVTDEEFYAFADQIWADVYAYSGLIPGVEYPVSDAERAFVKYDKEKGTYIQDAFYYSTYKSSYVTYGNCWTRTPAAADALAAMDEVAALYVVDYDGYTAWMDTGITSEKSTFIQSNGIAGLCEALAGALTDLAKTPFNDVVVTDYMSKWVNLDASTLKIVDNSTGETIWTAADGWLIDNAPTAKNPPVVVEKIASADYANGGEDVIGNTSGDIYKLTWYVKDGAMLRSDTYSLKYEVTVDTAEEGFEYNKEYPANGNTDLHYKDENGEDKTKEIEVPPVDGVKNTVDEIVIHKVDTNGNALNGAKFALYSGDTLIGEYAVEGGKVTIKDLKTGTYKLVETVTPNGYIGVSEPMYFEIVAKEDGSFEINHVFEEFELEFPSTAYEISNHITSVAIPQTFVLLEGDKADTWSYPGEYVFGESNYRVVYCGDSNVGAEDGTRYVKTTLEDCFSTATANKLRAIVGNSYPYATVAEVRAAAAAAGVADAENLTRGDMIAASQLAIWHYTNGVQNPTYKESYSVKDYTRWGKVFNDYADELPENLQALTGSTTRIVDEASAARVLALYTYLVNLAPESAAYSDVDVFFYTANGGKDVSQSLIGGDKPSFYVNGLDIFVKNVKVTVETPEIPDEPETSITVSFKNGDASNISFMLIDKETGEVEFLKKYDIGNETSYEIPTEEGKISAVFIKQSTSGMFWTSEEVSDEVLNDVIECLKDNNPSYKGHNAVASGEGQHQLEFKKNKFVTYTFAGDIANVDVKEEAKDEVKDEATESTTETEAPAEPEATATEPPATEPEHDFHATGNNHLLIDEADPISFNLDPNYKSTVDDKYAFIGHGEMSEFWPAILYYENGVGEPVATIGSKALYNKGKGANINGIYLDGVFYPGTVKAYYESVQQPVLMNGAGKAVAVYCADKATGTQTNTLYDVVNLENAEHFKADTAAKLRAIAVNGYWGGTDSVDPTGSLAKMKAMMKASGKFTQEEIDHLSSGVALAATQFAIWELANDGEESQIVNVQYLVENRVAYRNGKSYNTLIATPESEIACVDLIFKLSKYLTELPGISVKEMTTANTVLNYKNILQDVTIVPLQKADGHENNTDDNKDNDAYVTNVIFQMLPISEKDNLTAKIIDKVTKEVYAESNFSELKNNGDGTYTFPNVVLVENNVNNYTVVVEGVQYLERNVYLYFAGERGASQTMIGYDEGEFSVNVESTVEKTFNVDEPETPPTVTFEKGDASNISFMLLDPATGEVEFVKKYDIGSETSYEIPTEEGKISCVFVKQSTSGMFWFAQEVSEDMQQAVIDCLKANNPSYKGHNAIAFGEGDHELEFKTGKFVTYTFAGDIADVDVKEEVKEEVKNEVTDDATDSTTETTAPSEPVVPEVEETKPEAPKGELTVKVEGGNVKNWTVINGVTGIYIEANGKIPAVIWTSEKVDDATLAAFIAELGADPEAEVIYDFGSHDITYNHNKNKTKTVTFTFTNLAQEEPAPAAEVAETVASEPEVIETEASEPVVEETKPEVEETEPEVEETKASEPVVEETEPEATETEPEVEETKGNGKNKKNK